MATRHAHAELFGDSVVLCAPLRFSEEGLEHQQLFQRFRRAFERDFGATEVVANAVEVAGIILNKRPIAVVLATLHLEVITQDQPGAKASFTSRSRSRVLRHERS